jgi:predicted metalloprotease
VWNQIFKGNNITYREPKLVLFTQAVRSACGRASSAVGPFYCPTDQRVYLDLGFFDQLSRSLGAKGDFAAAYVVAHEVGHHVQNLLGVESFVNSRSASSERTRNQLSVKTELQADCFAGVWAKQTDKAKQVIEDGDINEAVTAAAAVGDDRLQQANRGEVMPDSFTHGSSAQRVEAFRQGFSDGNPQTCLDSYR